MRVQLNCDRCGQPTGAVLTGAHRVNGSVFCMECAAVEPEETEPIETSDPPEHATGAKLDVDTIKDLIKRGGELADRMAQRVTDLPVLPISIPEDMAEAVEKGRRDAIAKAPRRCTSMDATGLHGCRLRADHGGPHGCGVCSFTWS